MLLLNTRKTKLKEKVIVNKKKSKKNLIEVKVGNPINRKPEVQCKVEVYCEAPASELEIKGTNYQAKK